MYPDVPAVCVTAVNANVTGVILRARAALDVQCVIIPLCFMSVTIGTGNVLQKSTCD